MPNNKKVKGGGVAAPTAPSTPTGLNVHELVTYIMSASNGSALPARIAEICQEVKNKFNL
jgi:hypothetical protein